MPSEKIKIIMQSKLLEQPRAIRITVEKDMTYEDLLEIVSIQEKIPVAEYCFYHKRGTEFVRISMRDAVSPTKGEAAVHLKSMPFVVRLSHNGVREELQIEPADRADALRRKFAAASSLELEESTPLSFLGRRIEEETSMETLGVVDACVEQLNAGARAPPVEVFGGVRVTVRDEEVGTSAQLQVFPHETVEETMRKYCAAEDRVFVQESSLSVDGKEMDAFERIYDFQPRVENGSELHFSAAQYSVTVVDDCAERELDAPEAPRVQQTVEDHWTVAQLREEYTRRPDAKLITDKDRFFLKEAALNEDTMLVRLKLGEGGVLHLRRAEVESFNLYNCADCGAEVKLKSRDPVKCKCCFFRILYKQRTPKICQYNCR